MDSFPWRSSCQERPYIGLPPDLVRIRWLDLPFSMHVWSSGPEDVTQGPNWLMPSGFPRDRVIHEYYPPPPESLGDRPIDYNSGTADTHLNSGKYEATRLAKRVGCAALAKSNGKAEGQLNLSVQIAAGIRLPICPVGVAGQVAWIACVLVVSTVGAVSARRKSGQKAKHAQCILA